MGAISLPRVLACIVLALAPVLATTTTATAADATAPAAGEGDPFVGLYARDGLYEEIVEVLFDQGHYLVRLQPYQSLRFSKTAPDRLTETRSETQKPISPPPAWTLTLATLQLGERPPREVLYADFDLDKFYLVKHDSPKELLLNAAATGGLAGVRAALQAGADLDAKDDAGTSALELASRRGRLRDTVRSFEELDARFEIVRLLLESGAQVAQTEDPASGFRYLLVHDAVTKQRYELAKLLVQQGGDPAAINLYSVLRAEGRGSSEVNPEQRKLFDEVLKGVVFCPQRPAESSQILVEAVRSDDAEYFVRRLIEAGADVNFLNYTGHTPLTAAVMAGKAEIVRMLRAAGADPNKPVVIPESDYRMPDDPLDGMTPLQIAAARGDGNILRLLSQADAVTAKP